MSKSSFRSLTKRVLRHPMLVLVMLVATMLGAAAMLLFPVALRSTIDGTGLITPLAVFAGLFSAGVGARIVASYALAELVTSEMRTSVITRGLACMGELRRGEMLAVVTTDLAGVHSFLASRVPWSLRYAVAGIGAAAMIVCSVPASALAAIVAGSLGVSLVAATLGRAMRPTSRAAEARRLEVTDSSVEVLALAWLVRAFGQAARELNIAAQLQREAVRLAIRRGALHAARLVVIYLCALCAIAAGLWYGVSAVRLTAMTAGELGQLVGYLGVLAASIVAVSEFSGELDDLAASLDRLELAAPEEPDEPIMPVSAEQRMSRSQPCGCAVSVRGVFVSYPGTAAPALSDLTFELEPGETVAIVGPSGAGKSTLLAAILGLVDVSAGQVLIDGMRPTDVLVSGRTAIVPQDLQLFSRSVRDNIAYGHPEASDAEVIEAARGANAHQFIMALPQGYETVLGAQGAGLSVGQRQRICIARALLVRPGLLLLDEATSALDAESERAVESALLRTAAGRTTLVIAHRFRTIARTDRVIVIDAGQVVESGPPHALLRAGGAFTKLFGQQHDLPIGFQNVKRFA